jgi:hypothetical protein
LYASLPLIWTLCAVSFFAHLETVEKAGFRERAARAMQRIENRERAWGCQHVLVCVRTQSARDGIALHNTTRIPHLWVEDPPLKNLASTMAFASCAFAGRMTRIPQGWAANHHA